MKEKRKRRENKHASCHLDRTDPRVRRDRRRQHAHQIRQDPSLHALIPPFRPICKRQFCLPLESADIS